MIKTHEGKAVIYTDSGHKDKISKQLEVFYNPVMKTNRDLTVLFMNAIFNLKLNKRKLVVGLPLAGSGIRGIRFLLETKLVKELYMNDYDKKAIKNMKKNLRLNKVKAKTSVNDANIFMLQNKGFDFIDIDPFGSPNPFLDAAIKRLSRNGFLAITATDAAPLAGTFPKTCLWKYWSKNYLTPEKHEIGLRILIRKIQLIAAQQEKALIPVFSYAKDHYYRVIFLSKKSKLEAVKLIEKHKMYVPNFFKKEIGPLWFGQLQDKKILKEMIKLSNDYEPFLKVLLEEEKVNIVGFIDVHEYMKKSKLKGIKHIEIITKLKAKGYKAARTHFSYKGIRTNCELIKLKKIIKT